MACLWCDQSEVSRFIKCKLVALQLLALRGRPGPHTCTAVHDKVHPACAYLLRFSARACARGRTRTLLNHQG